MANELSFTLSPLDQDFLHAFGDAYMAAVLGDSAIETPEAAAVAELKLRETHPNSTITFDMRPNGSPMWHVSRGD